jgi:hypothetical protein
LFTRVVSFLAFVTFKALCPLDKAPHTLSWTKTLGHLVPIGPQ